MPGKLRNLKQIPLPLRLVLALGSQSDWVLGPDSHSEYNIRDLKTCYKLLGCLNPPVSALSDVRHHEQLSDIGSSLACSMILPSRPKQLLGKSHANESSAALPESLDRQGSGLNWSGSPGLGNPNLPYEPISCEWVQL